MDAGVAPIDIETKRRKEEMKLKEVQARAVAEHGELALIAVENPQTATQERISLRPPMLQVGILKLSYVRICILGIDGLSLVAGFGKLFWLLFSSFKDTWDKYGVYSKFLLNNSNVGKSIRFSPIQEKR